MNGLYRALGLLSTAAGLAIVGYTVAACWLVPAEAFRLSFALCLGVGAALHVAWAGAVRLAAVPDE
jgi:hypothetical protein